LKGWLVRTIRAHDIAGAVAAITEGDPGVQSERASYNALVLTGTAPRRKAFGCSV
jgi:hypothetical protein